MHERDGGALESRDLGILARSDDRDRPAVFDQLLEEIELLLRWPSVHGADYPDRRKHEHLRQRSQVRSDETAVSLP